MNYDTEAYEQAVNAQWLKLSKAESNDELKEVLSTWPTPKDFEIKEQDENIPSDDNEPTQTN